MDELLRRARIAWAGFAGLGDGFLGFVSCGSQLCIRLTGPEADQG